MKRSPLLPSLLALGLAAAPAFAQSSSREWLFLGARNIAGGTDRKTLTVTSERRLRELKLCVFNTPLHLNSATIRFDGGGRQEVPVHVRIDRGGCTKVIGLTRAPRRVGSIDLSYRTVLRIRRAPLVRIVGR